MSIPALEAVIFDCFGVLVTDGWLPFKHEHFGSDTAKLEHATELNHKVDAGLIGYDDFVAEIGAMAGVPPAEVDAHLKGVVPDLRVLELIAGLKPHYKIGMLSNVADDWLKSKFTAEHLAMFDAITLSFETGFIKPQPEAYEIAAERLDVAPETCVFIDDQERNVTAATEQGMTGIWYQDFGQFQADLAALNLTKVSEA